MIMEDLVVLYKKMDAQVACELVLVKFCPEFEYVHSIPLLWVDHEVSAIGDLSKSNPMLRHLIYKETIVI